MRCGLCGSSNDGDANYCNACGSVLTALCHHCGQNNRPESRFCKSCGRTLQADISPTAAPPTFFSPLPSTPAEMHEIVPGGERKYVTVLFTDLCGYTAMSERMDPEEVKDILSVIFREIVTIVKRYEGFVEKFVGDAIMSVFGALRTHEDDPLRAVRAAREIHQCVAALNPTYQARTQKPLAMHTGVNTGLVILGACRC